MRRSWEALLFVARGWDWCAEELSLPRRAGDCVRKVFLVDNGILDVAASCESREESLRVPPGPAIAMH